MSRSKNPTAYIATAAKCCLFEGLEKETLLALLSREGVSVGHFARGETIYAPDGFRRAIGVIISGAASVRKKQGDASMRMSTLGEDDIFGAAMLFCDEESYVATIQAIASTWALMITEQAFVSMMQDHFVLAENYMRYLTQRIRFLSGRIDGFVRPGCEERVLQYLVKRGEDGAELSMSAIAETLCISRASLYRALDALIERGLIKRNGRHIRLTEGE